MAQEKKRYRVIAPVVVCKTMGDHGWQYVHLQQGAPVPDDAGEDWIGYHLRDSLIAEVPSGAPPAAPPIADLDLDPPSDPPPVLPTSPTADPPKASPVVRRGPQQRNG